uniref:THO complex subunit 4-like n=1 Tax=Dermatophagoides pteronyssinus TaxID=6956 RepID=A0A6P6YEC7_DERPT|nr:THO complex subunit 4-like [Dermatophagoides pteronyssinus]
MDTESNSKIDMSLDEIIRLDRTKKFAGGGRMNNNRNNRNNYNHNQRYNNYRSFNNGRYNRNTMIPRRQSNFQQQSNRPRSINFNRNSSYQSATLHISNLAPNVTTEDLNELFMSFGNVNRAFVHYDQHGTSLGTGEVEFERRDEAIAARNKLNGVPLDGKPLHITMINSQVEDSFTSFLRSKTSSSRQSSNNRANNYSHQQQPRRRFNNNNNNNNNNNHRNKNISADDLDRDLDEWRQANSDDNKIVNDNVLAETDEMIDDMMI